MSIVSLVKCEDYRQDKVDQAVRKAVALTGGIEKIVKPGDRVFLKVNLTSPRPPEEAVTTHPAVVKAVGKILKEAGAEILLGETCSIANQIWLRLRQEAEKKLADKSPGEAADVLARLDNAEKYIDLLAPKLPGEKKPLFTQADFRLEETYEQVYKITGMAEAAAELGAELVTFDKEEWVQAENPRGRFLKQIWTIRPLLEADVIIGLPKLKTHNVTLLTGAVKNFLGIVPGRFTPKYHRTAKAAGRMAEMLVDIFEVARPQLSIMDGIIGMEGQGPLEGEPRPVGAIIAGTDSVAVDAVASRIIGIEALEVGTTAAAAARGLGTADPEKIEIAGEPIERMAVRDFRRPAD